jgi:hypothetical protein
MTGITDQDKRDALAWEGGSQAIGIADAAARVILATVDAPPPSLMDRMMDWWTHHHEDQVAFSTLAESVDQMEHDLAEARAEVERLTAERVTDPSPTLNDPSMTRPATVAREENVSPDLPDPADVPAGQPWEVRVGGKSAVGIRANYVVQRWLVWFSVETGTPRRVPDERITLITPLLPADPAR